LTGSEEGNRLPERHYNDADLAVLRSATGGAAPVLAVADFSPGPWWGFNGVQRLVLTADRLFVVQSGYALTRGRLRRSFPIAEVQTANWRFTRRFGFEGVQMRLKVKGRSRTYSSKYRQGADLAEQLSGLVKGA
jgi:hypothetical protein